MEEKIYQTNKEQIEILKKRGLVINDEKQAEKILKRTNYYNLINGYKSPFLDEKYVEGCELEEIKALYRFDKSISRLFLSAILELENTLKTIISDVFSSKYGHKDSDYLKIEHFNNDIPKWKKQNLINRLKKYIREDTPNKQYLLHYKYKHKYIPLWVLVNYMTLNEIVWFYEIMKTKDRIEVSKKLSENTKIMHNDLELLLLMIRDYRNIAAHDERFYDAQTKNSNGIRFKVKFNRNKYKVESIYTSVFALLLSLKVLFLPKEFETFCISIINEIKKLEKGLKSIKLVYILNEMDFCNDEINLKKIDDICLFFGMEV